MVSGADGEPAAVQSSGLQERRNSALLGSAAPGSEAMPEPSFKRRNSIRQKEETVRSSALQERRNSQLLGNLLDMGPLPSSPAPEALPGHADDPDQPIGTDVDELASSEHLFVEPAEQRSSQQVDAIVALLNKHASEFVRELNNDLVHDIAKTCRYSYYPPGVPVCDCDEETA
jgi:hypothetical protein